RVLSRMLRLNPSAPHAAVVASLSWRTRNSPAAVLCRSTEDGDRHWGCGGGVRIPSATIAQHCIEFEPNPSTHLGSKRALPEIETHQVAVSAVEGDATLRIPVVDGIPYIGWGTIEPKNQLAELPPHTVDELRVRTARPDRMALGDVSFIKIDVEGHEL